MVEDLVLVGVVSIVLDFGVIFFCWNLDDNMVFGFRNVKFWNIFFYYRESGF